MVGAQPDEVRVAVVEHGVEVLPAGTADGDLRPGRRVVGETERAGRRGERPRRLRALGALELGEGHRAGREVREVLAQGVQVEVGVLAGAVVLVVPVVGEDAAVHVAHPGATALVAGLDGVVELVERLDGEADVLAAVGVTVGRVPGGDGRPEGPLAALPGLGRVHRPEVATGAVGDRLPHLLRRDVDLELADDLELLGHDGLLLTSRRGGRRGRLVLDRGVEGDDDPVVAPLLGVRGVVLAHQRAHARRQLLHERGAVGGRGEPDLAVQGVGREPLAGLRGAGDQRTDVPDEPGPEREQPAGGQLVAEAVRIGLHRGERDRRDHVRRGGRPHQPLGDVALAPLTGQLHQAVPLQGLQVVVHLLPRQPDLAGQHRGRRGPGGQLGQQPGPDGVQGDGGGLGVLDDGHIQHGSTLSPTNYFVQSGGVVGDRVWRG